MSKRQDQNASSSSRNMSKRQDQNASSSSGEVEFVRLCEDIVHKMEKALKRGKVILNRRACQHLATRLSVIISCIREHQLWLWIHKPKPVVAGHLAALYRYYEKAGELVRQCAEQDWCAAAVFQDGNLSSFSYILDLIKSSAIRIVECFKIDGRTCIVSKDLNFVAEPLFIVSVGYDGDKNELRKRLEGLASEWSTSSSCRICGFFLPDQAASKQQHLARYLLKRQKFQSEYKTSSFTSEALTTILWEKEDEPEGTWGVPEFLGAGSGASGVLKTSWLGVPCAKKEFHGEASEVIFMKEAWIMARLGKHPCIVDFICCGNGKERGDRFIAMELMEKNLFDLIEDRQGLHFSHDVALDIILQIANGVKFLHQNGVAHRDLKPQNVVVKTLRSPYHEDYYCVKLVDFGTSKSEVEVLKANTMTFRGVGTTRYRAPEVHPNAHPEGLGKVDWFKADAYSFAMTCAHILTLEQPFEDMETLSNLYAKLLDGQRPILPRLCSKELVHLVEECWSTNRHERPRFDDIYLRLKVIVSSTFQVSIVDMVHGKEYPRAKVCSSTHTSVVCTLVVAVRAQPGESPAEDEVTTSTSESIGHGMSRTSSLGLQQPSGWCTPPRIFVEHQDEAIPHPTSAPTSATTVRPAQQNNPPAKNKPQGNVRISAWRLAKLYKAEATRAAASARKASSILRPVPPPNLDVLNESEESYTSNSSRHSIVSTEFGTPEFPLQRVKNENDSRSSMSLSPFKSELPRIRTGRESEVIATWTKSLGMDFKSSSSSSSKSSFFDHLAPRSTPKGE